MIQVPAKGFPQDRLTKLAEALFTEVKPDSLVISPIADEFVPFTTALRNLRGRTSAAGR